MAIIQESTAPAGHAPGEPLPSRPKLPGFIYVGQQARRDWFGKDVQETPTVSYVWTADQFGHFGLGFQITYAVGWIAILAGYGSPPVLVGVAVANILLWVTKEVFDFRREAVKASQAQSVFKFNSKEIWWNVFTALYYIGIGAFVAGAAAVDPKHPIHALYALGIIILPSYLLAVWWLRRKITFQQAGLPYLYRLATYPNEIDRDTAEFIVELSKPAVKPRGNHLVISGPLGSGKSSLAVGIGTEFAFRLGIGRYTTLITLLQQSVKQERPKDSRGVENMDFDDGRILWPWETSDLLIVDDVDVITGLDPNVPEVADAPLNQSVRLLALARQALDPRYLAGLKDRRTVWVVGDVHDGALESWRTLLANLMGISPDEVRTLDLTKKISEVVAAKRGMAPMTPAQQVKQ